MGSCRDHNFSITYFSKMRVLFALTATFVGCQLVGAFQQLTAGQRIVGSSPTALFSDSQDSDHNAVSARRQMFQGVAAISFASLLGTEAVNAVTPTGPGDGLLDDLPNDALRSYLQYRIALQIFADFYMFELQRLVADTDEWGDVGQLFRVNNNKGQGSPSRIEREFTNIVRILGLSLPPDESDAMRDAQFKFEKAMAKISKATAGIRRDLPVEISKDAVPAAKAGWEEGRVALNEVFAVLNVATGLPEMKGIPPPGPNQAKDYGRSSRRYFELVKKTKLCQNRGGPALSQGWGKLMVSGYLQDSCGLPGKYSSFGNEYLRVLVIDDHVV